jgi:hypothetical protein
MGSGFPPEKRDVRPMDDVRQLDYSLFRGNDGNGMHAQDFLFGYTRLRGE